MYTHMYIHTVKSRPNCTHYDMWDKIINQFPNFNGTTVEYCSVCSYLYCLSMLILKLTLVCKRGLIYNQGHIILISCINEFHFHISDVV